MERGANWQHSKEGQHEAGVDAYQNGQALDSNPWREGSAWHAAWRDGWFYAYNVDTGRPHPEDAND